MKIGEKVKRYREEHDLSQRQFATLCNVSNGYISMLEEGKNPRTNEPITPTLSTIEKIAKAMGMSALELIDESAAPPANVYECPDEENPWVIRAADAMEKLPVDMQREVTEYAESLSSRTEGELIFLDKQKIRLVPLYESVSAGFGAYANDCVVDYIPTVIMSETEAAETIAIKVHGDSMYPKIEDGDTIIVHKQESVDSTSVAVVLLDGEDGLVKKVIYGRDWIELHSFNPMYPPLRFEGAEVLRLRVVGLVKQVMKNI